MTRSSTLIIGLALRASNSSAWPGQPSQVGRVGGPPPSVAGDSVGLAGWALGRAVVVQAARCVGCSCRSRWRSGVRLALRIG